MNKGLVILAVIGTVGLVAVAKQWTTPEVFTAWFTDIWVGFFKSAVFAYIAGGSVILGLILKFATQSK